MLIFLLLVFGQNQSMRHKALNVILSFPRKRESSKLNLSAKSWISGQVWNDNTHLIFLQLIFVLCILLISQSNAQARLENKVNENQRQYGKEIISKQFSETEKNFAGKKVYQFPLYGWRVEAIYRDGRSFSETARPRGNKVKKQIITEREANAIADMLYPRKERGRYRKQINNANFVSHFFEHGVVSYEMQLDDRRKNHIGVIGVRSILYSDGKNFKSVKVNAYH